MEDFGEAKNKIQRAKKKLREYKKESIFGNGNNTKTEANGTLPSWDILDFFRVHF